jgi:hypothetical protein
MEKLKIVGDVLLYPVAAIGFFQSFVNLQAIIAWITPLLQLLFLVLSIVLLVLKICKEKRK